MRDIMVLALGGHAILPKTGTPSIGRQFLHTRRAMREVAATLRRDAGLIITHGNGPQVGHILIRSEVAAGKAYPIPLSVAVAESEGEIGYVIQQSLHNALASAGMARPIVTVLTQVVVDPGDPAFENPTKPIGPFFNRAKASVIRKKGVPLAHVPGHGWRRVVPSPRPLEIVEGETVRALGGQDVVVIAAGGGGIPVTRHRGRLRGVDAVIDKDLASAVLAHDVGARELVLLTDVRKVSLDFQQPSQTDLDAMTASEAERYAARGHFPPGSMGPKVEAAAMFVRGGGKRAIITSPGFLGAALEGKDGTCVTP